MQRVRLLVRLALRNVRRQVRRSFLTASAMVVSLILLMFSRAIADGAHDKWIEGGVRLGSGHVAFQAPGYAARHAIEYHLGAASLAAVDRALADRQISARVAAVAHRVEIAGLAASAAAAVPVSVQAVVPAEERAFSEMDRRLVQGRYLDDADRLAGYVGEGLARRLQLELGDRLVLTAQALDSSITQQLVRVVGTFRTGIPEVDQGLVQIPLGTAQQWLGLGHGATAVAVLLHDSWETDGVVARARDLLEPDTATIAVLSWRQAMPELDAAVRVDDAGDYVFHAVLFLIVALAIVNTVLMSVLQRTREFGVIRALGLRRRDSAALVTLETLLLAGVSGVVGVALGLAVTWGLFRHGVDFTRFMGDQFTAAGTIIDPVFIPQFRFIQIVQSLAFIVVIGLLASLYPAWRATRIEITEAMKFEG
jgi:ABC-type lipoprotein release transport system permease subunit